MSKPKITITGKDLKDEDRTEQLADLFGRSTVYNAMKHMSEQVTGDGTLEQIQDMVAGLNPQQPEDEKRYEKLRVRMEKESKRLVEPNEATFDIEVNDTVSQRLFENRDKAKELLGEVRYFSAVFPLGAKADRKTLRKYNPQLQNNTRGQTPKDTIKMMESEIEKIKGNQKKKIDNM